MPIFNESPNEKLKREANTLMAQTETQAQQIIQTFQEFTNFVWNHPIFTPQQVLDTFGNDAARLFVLSNAVQPLIKVYTGNEINPVPRNYTFKLNDDGTVTFNPDIHNGLPDNNHQ